MCLLIEWRRDGSQHDAEFVLQETKEAQGRTVVSRVAAGSAAPHLIYKAPSPTVQEETVTYADAEALDMLMEPSEQNQLCLRVPCHDAQNATLVFQHCLV